MDTRVLYEEIKYTDSIKHNDNNCRQYFKQILGKKYKNLIKECVKE
jgi:hypothetical protein